MTEKILGIMVSTVTGESTLFSGLSNVHCRLIFTNERVVVQRTTAQMQQNIPNYKIDPYVAKVLVERGIASLLADSSENVSVPYSDIVSVDIGRRWLNPRMNIVTKERVYRFTWFWPWAITGKVERVVHSMFPIEIPVQRVKKI